MISQYWETDFQYWETGKEYWETAFFIHKGGSNKTWPCFAWPPEKFREVLECGSPLPLFSRDLATQKRQRAAAFQEAGASAYNWTCTPNTPGGVALNGQSTAANFTFTGLTPGVAYTIAGNAVGAAGPSNWSNPVTLIAI